jgi:hypothetical protein
VEFAQPNFKTYSTEFTKLLLAIGSEVDVLCKIICERIDPAAKRGNIDDYRACIVPHNARITTEEVLIRRYDLVFKPWDAWSRDQNPSWWRSYNNVKHERNAHYHEANLENCANAVGGMPLLGYDIDPQGSKLRINDAEAARVRAIFALYLEYQALGPVVRELDRRRWRTKRWRTRKGHFRGGRAFTRNTLRQLLGNVTYLGHIRYRQEVYPGEHAAIVDLSTWQTSAVAGYSRSESREPASI